MSISKFRKGKAYNVRESDTFIMLIIRSVIFSCQTIYGYIIFSGGLDRRESAANFHTGIGNETYKGHSLVKD